MGNEASVVSASSPVGASSSGRSREAWEGGCLTKRICGRAATIPPIKTATAEIGEVPLMAAMAVITATRANLIKLMTKEEQGRLVR